MRSFHVFYAFHPTGESKRMDSVDPVHEVCMTEEDVYFELGPKLCQDGDFFGLIHEGRILQFLYQGGPGNVLLDLPDTERRGSYTKELTLDELGELLKNLPPAFVADAFPGVEFGAF